MGEPTWQGVGSVLTPVVTFVVALMSVLAARKNARDEMTSHLQPLDKLAPGPARDLLADLVDDEVEDLAAPARRRRDTSGVLLGAIGAPVLVWAT